MNIKKILYLFIVTIISLIGLTSVYAKTGEKLTLDAKSYINLVGPRKEAKFHTTMGYGWCITPEKKGADQGTTFTYVNDETDGGYLYLLNNSKTDDRSYLVTQLAVWLYKSNYMPDTYWNNSSSQIVIDAKALANAARNNKNYNTKPAISIVNNDKAMKLVKEGNTYYYISGELSAKLTNATEYKVTLSNAPTGTKILNSSNKEVSTLKAGEKFKIKVPEANVTANKTIKVTVSASGTRKYIERYRPSNTAKQDLIVLRSENVTVNSSSELTITPKKRTCDIFNGKYYGEDGTIVDKEEYEKQCIHKCEPYNGEYYGEDGTKVDKEEYEKQCKHVCEPYNGEYYGEDGTIVDEETYNEQCNHVCEEYKGKYFDSFGKETTLEEYIRQCKHTCEIYNGKYYGKNGNEVDAITYENECNPSTVVVPPTGSNKMPIGMYLLIGILPIAGGTKLILKSRKEN